MLSISKIKQSLKKVLPRPLLIGKPVCQVYINDNLRTTTLTLTQFPSLFFPETKADYHYEITFYNIEGKTLGREILNLNKFSSKQIHLADLKIAKTLPEYGLMSVKLKTSSLNLYSDLHLGVLNPFFYVLYHSVDYSSNVLVHPQSRMNERSGDKTNWKSNMAIPTENVEQLEIFQINPLLKSVDTILKLCDSKSTNSIFEEKISLKPLTVRRILIDKSLLIKQDYVSVQLMGMTGQNSKPLIFSHFNNKTFSGCHT